MLDFYGLILGVGFGIIGGFANLVRGGIYGEEIKAALNSIHPYLRMAWTSVGDRLLTTPLVLVAIIALLVPMMPWYGLLTLWLVSYLSFILGWGEWFDLGRNPQDPTDGKWMETLLSILLFPFGKPKADGSSLSDGLRLGIRGLLITGPFAFVFGLFLPISPTIVVFGFIGFIMWPCYWLGWQIKSSPMMGRWNLSGTGGGEFLFGYAITGWLAATVAISYN